MTISSNNPIGGAKLEVSAPGRDQAAQYPNYQGVVSPEVPVQLLPKKPWVLAVVLFLLGLILLVVGLLRFEHFRTMETTIPGLLFPSNPGIRTKPIENAERKEQKLTGIWVCTGIMVVGLLLSTAGVVLLVRCRDRVEEV